MDHFNKTLFSLKPRLFSNNSLIQELQTAQLESDKINGKRKIKLQSKKMTIDQQTQAPVNKLPPISDKHSISKAAQFRLQVKKEKTTMMRLPPIWQ